MSRILASYYQRKKREASRMRVRISISVEPTFLSEPPGERDLQMEITEWPSEQQNRHKKQFRKRVDFELKRALDYLGVEPEAKSD